MLAKPLAAPMVLSIVLGTWSQATLSGTTARPALLVIIGAANGIQHGYRVHLTICVRVENARTRRQR
jgi:hypothetical protein